MRIPWVIEDNINHLYSKLDSGGWLFMCCDPVITGRSHGLPLFLPLPRQSQNKHLSTEKDLIIFFVPIAVFLRLLEVNLLIPFEVWIVGQDSILGEVNIHFLLYFCESFLEERSDDRKRGGCRTSSALFKSTRLAMGSA